MTINKIKLRKLSSEDLAELKVISHKTYLDAFAAGNSKENMRAYLDYAFNEQKLLSEINEKLSIFYFAKYNNQTVGYLKVNFGSAQTDLKDENSMELERIYVLEEFQGKRIGQKMLTEVINMARTKKVNYLWLGVWDENKKAITFYKNHGFTIFSSHLFKMGTEIQTDLLMKLSL